MKDCKPGFSMLDTPACGGDIGGEYGARLNFDVRSYQFDDLDLEIAVRRLSLRDQNILILHLMGHRQRDIAEVCALSRSMISRKLRQICHVLKELLTTDSGYSMLDT